MTFKHLAPCIRFHNETETLFRAAGYFRDPQLHETAKVVFKDRGALAIAPYPGKLLNRDRPAKRVHYRHNSQLGLVDGRAGAPP
jgi:hypothetical protein